MPTRPVSTAVKRIMDVCVAGAGLVLSMPVIAAVAAVIRITMGRPVVFTQMRPGLNGQPFPLYKFRTMTDERGSGGRLLPDAQRLTPWGRLLRSTSLDELPELWNVLRGDMSLVGPRPLLIQYLPLYTQKQRRRHDVRPGLTGWAQVNGRNELTWAERLAMDVWYVDHWTLSLDLRILVRTIGQVVGRKGVVRTGHATMPLFTGAPDVEV